MFCLVLEFSDEKWTFAKIEGGNVNFFSFSRAAAKTHRPGSSGEWHRPGEAAATWANKCGPEAQHNIFLPSIVAVAHVQLHICMPRAHRKQCTLMMRTLRMASP
jgi:hypothetical protein